MSDLVDLHLHSTYSDGVLTPTELVHEASVLGLRAIALADHDNVDGIEEAVEAGRELGIEVVSGVELSVVWENLNDLHLLGYAFDHKNPPFVEALAMFRDFRAGRSRRVLENINRVLESEGRSPIDPCEVAGRAGGTMGRPHIGQVLVEKKYVRDMDEAFARYLIPCNEPKRFLPIADAIAMIHSAGGCAVLAHPPFLNLTDEALRECLETFRAMGLDGLEAYNSGADNAGIDRYITIARRMALVVTGGSDFHQPQKGGIAIGSGRGNLKIPYHCVEEIRTVSEKYR